MKYAALLVVAQLGTGFAALAQGGPPHPHGPPSVPPGPATPGRFPGPPAPDPIQGQLFPPELIMQNQQQLKLDKKQRQLIIKEIQQTQSRIVELQFAVQEAVGTLGSLVKATRIDEDKALAQSDRLMQLESKLKREHLGLLIRLKNLLTTEQQQYLQTLQVQRHEGTGGAR